MRIKERFEKLKKAAQADAHAVRNRRTIFAGVYPKKAPNLDGAALLEQIRTAATLGYETYLRVADERIEVYLVAEMPSTPFDVLYP